MGDCRKIIYKALYQVWILKYSWKELDEQELKNPQTKSSPEMRYKTNLMDGVCYIRIELDIAYVCLSAYLLIELDVHQGTLDDSFESSLSESSSIIFSNESRSPTSEMVCNLSFSASSLKKDLNNERSHLMTCKHCIKHQCCCE